MKLIILLLITLSLNAQVNLGVYHDVKLGLKGDGANPAGTTDIIFEMEWRGKQFKTHYFALKTQYEYADLTGGKFQRYSVNVGWAFNKLIVDKLEAGIFAGIGMIHRGKEMRLGGLPSYSITGEISYPIAKRLRVGGKYEIVYRSDLKALWDEDKLYKPNFSIGIKYQILNQ